MRIPGISELTDGEENLLPTLFLLEGPLGVGKREYCTKFLEDGINDNAYCIVVSARITDSQFKDLFYKIDQKLLKDKFKFINPLLSGSGYDDVSLDSVYKEIFSFLHLDNKKRKQVTKQDKDPAMSEKQVCMVIESLNQLCDIFDVDAVRKFLSKLTVVVKKIGATAIYTIDTPVIDKYIPVTSFCEGKLEMKFEDTEGNPLSRKIRLLSSSHVISSPKWIDFAIDYKGMVTFGDNLVACTMDSKPIQGIPIYHNDMPFCSENCIKTFKKLSPLFAPINPKPVVLDYHFFFIDIVGLSDPKLVVAKQKEKIERLNGFIKDCDAYRKTPDDAKIILPTGDGMAIGFMENPELPYKLSAELHRYLRKYNKRKTGDDLIHVRIGLSSGPVFTVMDITDKPDVWGPGIIMARRVMDLGDSWHILIADNLANQLKPLTEEYRRNIREIGEHEIKHGEKIKVFLACSEDYGNPQIPEVFKK